MKRFGFVYSLNGAVANAIVEATNEGEAVAKFEATYAGATILIISTGMRK